MIAAANHVEIKDRLAARLREKQGEIVDLCARLVRAPSPNPPGDTREVADILVAYLSSYGIPSEIQKSHDLMPNVIARVGSAGSGPVLVMNGHIDVFPVDPSEHWSFEPYAGLVQDGRILGRGTADMKGGVTASVAAATTIAELGIPVDGSVLLTLVSDEEMGARYGTSWLLDISPSLRGDFVLSGEPTGPGLIWYGERGVNDWVISAEGVAGPGAAYGFGESAIDKLAAAIPVVEALDGTQGSFPDELQSVVSEAKAIIEEEIGAGRSRVLDIVTLNIGLIRGGTNPAVTPAYAEMITNFRVPFGVDPHELTAALEGRLKAAGVDVRVAFMHEERGISPATYTTPQSKLVTSLQANVERVTGQRPRLGICGGATDMRFYRRQGVPAVMHGPRSYPVFAATPDEFIHTQELLDVTIAHALTTIDLLGVRNA